MNDPRQSPPESRPAHATSVLSSTESSNVVPPQSPQPPNATNPVIPETSGYTPVIPTHATRPIHCYDEIQPGMRAGEDAPQGIEDYDFKEEAREREMLHHDLASDNGDFARSDEEGWYYSDGI